MSKAQATVALPPIDGETPLQRFERELHARYPDQLVKGYDLPSNIRQARRIYMIEITSRDELRAAIQAEGLMEPMQRASVKLASDAERKECVRNSIVGIVTRTEPIAYRHVNHDGMMLLELNGWPTKAWTAFYTFFNDLNGVSASELAEGLKGARIVGASEPPTSAILASASTEK